jgi:hypothetical protein
VQGKNKVEKVDNSDGNSASESESDGDSDNESSDDVAVEVIPFSRVSKFILYLSLSLLPYFVFFLFFPIDIRF